MSEDIIRPGSAGMNGHTFHGHVVRRVRVRGQEFFIARDCGAALGYENGARQFITDLTGEWSAEIREGAHWHRLRGDDLRQAKASVEVVGADPTTSGADDLTFVPELIVLTEAGLNLALMKSGKPRAVEFRLWLAEDVVPEVARTGKYDPTATAAAPTIPPSEALRRAELAAEGLRAMGEHINSVDRAAVAAHIIGFSTGMDPKRLLPVQEQRWKRPTEIEREIGAWRHEVSTAIKELGLKERKDLSRIVRDVRANGVGGCDCYEYNEQAVEMIRVYIAEHPYTPKRPKKKAPAVQASLATDPAPANDAPVKEGPTAA